MIIGSTCAGKTTLARSLAQRLCLPHIELDALHWGPNWTASPTETFRQSITEALDGDAWVIDGNYSKTQDTVWPRADTIVWLDYAFPVILVRLFKRTLGRVIKREVLWNGNQETWRGAFFSRDSLFMWAITTHAKRRKRYLRRFQELANRHFTVVRLRSPKETQMWLEGLSPSV